MGSMTEIGVDRVTQLLTRGANRGSEFVEVLTPAFNRWRAFTEKRRALCVQNRARC